MHQTKGGNYVRFLDPVHNRTAHHLLNHAGEEGAQVQHQQSIQWIFQVEVTANNTYRPAKCRAFLIDENNKSNGSN